MRSMRSERGGIITGWLLKLVVSLAVVGVFAFEAGAVIVARVTVDTVAGDAAGEAASAYGRTGSADDARSAAVEYVHSHGGSMTGFTIAPDGRSISVTVEKRAKTLFLHRIGFSKSWAIARSTRSRAVT